MNKKLIALCSFFVVVITVGAPGDFRAYAEFESPKEKELFAIDWTEWQHSFIGRIFSTDLGPDYHKLWELTKKSEMDLKMPQYGTYERWQYDMARFPSFAECFGNLTEKDWFEERSLYEYSLRHYLSIVWFKVLTRPHMPHIKVKEKRELLQQLKIARMRARYTSRHTKERQQAAQVIEEIRKEMANSESYVAKKNREVAKKNRELKVSQSAVSSPRYIMLREFGPPFSVEVLTIKGKWVERGPGNIATSRERWKYFGSDDLYYFTDGKLAAYEEEKGKEIRMGMPYWEIYRKWGSPGSINRSVGSWGVHEQWVYGNTYLYFENGILTSFQD